jgi:hypothetical protein
VSAIGDTLRHIAKVRGPNDPRLVPGTPAEQRQARAEWRRERDAQGIVAKWDEIPAERLSHSRYWIEDTTTGNLYRPVYGDPAFCDGVCAYYRREDGSPVMLEPNNPPSLSAIAERQAAQERRRVDKAAAAKARYAALRRASR